MFYKATFLGSLIFISCHIILENIDFSFSIVYIISYLINVLNGGKYEEEGEEAVF